MEVNPYKAPKQNGHRLPRFRPSYIPLLVAGAIGAIVFVKLAILFIELAVSLVREGLPKIPARH